MMQAVLSFETSVFTRAIRRNIPEDNILHDHRRDNLKSHMTDLVDIVSARTHWLSSIDRGKDERLDNWTCGSAGGSTHRLVGMAVIELQFCGCWLGQGMGSHANVGRESRKEELLGGGGGGLMGRKRGLTTWAGFGSFKMRLVWL
jgi:hypothetical protein